MEEVIGQVAVAVECWVKQGIDRAMNEYNWLGVYLPAILDRILKKSKEQA